MSDNSDNSGDDKTGYGNPPKHTRFKKGQSGNPKGRPKKSKNVKTVLKEVLDKPIQITFDGKTETVSILEAIIKRLSIKALNGDLRATSMLIKEWVSYFPDLVPPEVPKAKLTIMNICTECSKENTDEHPSNKILNE